MRGIMEDQLGFETDSFCTLFSASYVQTNTHTVQLAFWLYQPHPPPPARWLAECFCLPHRCAALLFQGQVKACPGTLPRPTLHPCPRVSWILSLQQFSPLLLMHILLWLFVSSLLDWLFQGKAMLWSNLDPLPNFRIYS